MKKIKCILLCIVMIFCIVGCGNYEANALQDSSSALELMLNESDILRQAILDSSIEIAVSGTSYYVSNNGDDANDGLSPETAWATVKRVSDANLSPGDGIFFERGSVFREHVLFCQNGVSYSAYGEGAKPVITSSPENGADPEKWSLWGETPDGGKVWIYHRNMRDCGTMVLNGDIGVQKIAPYWNGFSFVSEDGQPFDILTGLNSNYCFFSPADSMLNKNAVSERETIAGWSIGVPLFEDIYCGTEGALYFRCDEGNPGDVFDSIEFAMRPIEAGDALVYLHADNIIEGLCISANAACGIMHLDGIGTMCQIQNCEISFCGGYVLFYDDQGRPEMAGDGMNIQRPCIIENNYIHHNSDNGITMEYGDDSENVIISGITISGNLFEYNGEDLQIVSFDSNMKERGCAFRDILIDNNYMLYTCSGSRNYCQAEMVDGKYQAYYILKCGDFSTPLYSENLVIRNNILYSESVRSYFNGGNIGYEPPVFENNTLYLKPCVQMPENSGAVALWANDAYAGEDHTEWLWIFDDHVWPEEFGVKDWNSFLNEYLGTGNTLVFVDD